MGFPLNSNDPYIESTGERSTLGAKLASGGGGSYTLPTASAETKGGVKIGSGLTMTGEVLSADSYSLPTASSDTLGGVKVGSGLSIADGVLSATGGSGGGGGHCFTLETSGANYKKVILFTTADSISANAASFMAALKDGIAIIVKGKDNTAYVPTQLRWVSDTQIEYEQCTLTIDNSTIKTTWTSSGSVTLGSISISNIVKIY